MSEHKIRVLHVISGLGVGGAERVLCNLLEGGLDEEFSNVVLSLTPGGYYEERLRRQGVKVFSLPKGSMLIKIRSGLRLLFKIRNEQPQIIQGWMYHGNLFAVVLHAFLGMRPKLIWNIRQSLYDLNQEKFFTQKVIRLGAKLSSIPDCTLYNSHIAKAQHENFGFSANKTWVIPNGFDTDKFSPDVAKRRIVRMELNVPREALVIGAVGRWHPVKCLAGFLRVCTKLIARGADIYVLAAGKGVHLSNGEVRAHIPSELSHRYFLLGEREDIPDILRAMDIYCLNSRAEGFPNSLGEAMACAKPCIATDVGDCAILLNGNGMLINPEDDEDLLRALTAVISLRDEERESMGEAARTRIKNAFTLCSLVSAYICLYKNVLEGA